MHGLAKSVTGVFCLARFLAFAWRDRTSVECSAPSGVPGGVMVECWNSLERCGQGADAAGRQRCTETGLERIEVERSERREPTAATSSASGPRAVETVSWWGGESSRLVSKRGDRVLFPGAPFASSGLDGEEWGTVGTACAVPCSRWRSKGGEQSERSAAE